MAITFTSDLDIKLNRITNVGAPTALNDAATKQYADAIATGIIWKAAVRAASSVDINLAAPGPVDGVALVANDRVLLMGQTNAALNGIYSFDGTALARSADADSSAELTAGTAVTASEGTDNGNHTFVLITDGTIVIDTTPQQWTLLNAGTSQVYTEGDGINIDASNVVSAVAAPSAGLSVDAAGIGVVADPAGGLQTTGTGVGTKLVADSGLAVDTSGLRFVPRPDAGLDMDSAGVGVMIAPATGLALGASGVSTVLAPDMGLSVDASGLAVKAGNGVAVDAAGVSVKPAQDQGLAVDASGVSVMLRPDDGLDVDATGIGITTDANGALVTGVNGIGVSVTADTGLVADATGLHTVLDPAGGLRVDNLGIKVLADPAVASDPAKPSLVVSATGVAVNAALFPRKIAQSIGDGAATSFPITHSLNSTDVLVEVYEVSTGMSVYADVSRNTADQVTVAFGVAPSSGQYRVVILG